MTYHRINHILIKKGRYFQSNITLSSPTNESSEYASMKDSNYHNKKRKDNHEQKLNNNNLIINIDLPLDKSPANEIVKYVKSNATSSLLVNKFNECTSEEECDNHDNKINNNHEKTLNNNHLISNVHLPPKKSLIRRKSIIYSI